MTSQIQKTEVVFIDSRVENYQTLLEGLNPAAEVVLLDPNQDGIEQITADLSQRQNLESLHIISHGEAGSLQLGNTELNSNNLSQYASNFEQWQNALTANADLLLYGCNVATDSLGQSFVTNLAQLTQADLAASTDLTGNVALGGNWTLEFSTGTIEADLAFDAASLNRYNGILAQPATNFVIEPRPSVEKYTYIRPGANDPAQYTMAFQTATDEVLKSFTVSVA